MDKSDTQTTLGTRYRAKTKQKLHNTENYKVKDEKTDTTKTPGLNPCAHEG
jgi:hypothetical protein